MIMADEKNTSEVQNPVAVADVLQTTPKQYPISASSGSVDKVMAQKADVAEREAKNAQLLASRTNETMAPIDEMQKNKIFGTQQILDDIGKQQQKPFKPPQETVADFAELGGLVAVVGAMLGTSGKMSANNVIGAMTGIMEGYKKGRTDLVANSYKEFEANMKRLQAQSQNATAQLDNYTKLVAVDRDAATRVLAEYKAELNKGVAADKVLADSGFDAIKTKSQIAQLAIKQKELDQKINKDVVDSMVNHQMKGQDGKLYYVDPRDMKTKEVPNQMSPVPKPAGGRSAIQQQFVAQRTINALGGIASVAEGIQNLPANTNIGVLQNLQTRDGMFNAIRNAAGRKLSNTATKEMEALYSGVTRNLAAIEASGAATGLVGLGAQMEKLIPKAGDDTYTVALKIADMRRIATENIIPLVESGLLLPGQQQSAEKLIEQIKKAIPYTVDDVIAAKYKGKKTLRDAGLESVNRESNRETTGSQSTPTEQEFFEKVSEVNPNMTPAQIKAKYKELYGSK